MRHAADARDRLPIAQFHPTDEKIAQIDLNAANLGRCPIDLGLGGDIAATLDALPPSGGEAGS
jgi:thiamine pyrophosphate-dependent acetolactate synthase large subunit-like protein